MTRSTLLVAAAMAGAAVLPPPTQAQNLVTERSISAGLAAEAAAAAVEACAARGWRIAATVVDRHGVVKATLRADGAGPHTVGSSFGKAFTAASARNNTSTLLEAVRANPNALTLPDIPGFLVLGGGIPIRAREEVVGAIGVAGAPGGHMDDQCAEAAIVRIRDRLEQSQD